ncbi:hypothetical protein NUACC21_78750 [Scytonema sp. NUACC21]
MQISQIYPIGHLLLAISDLVLLGWSIRLWRQSNNLAIILVQIVLASLVYDNTVLFAGSFLQPGELLLYLNKIRFLVHYLSLPLLIVVGVNLAYRAGATWATPMIQSLSWVLAICLGILDVIRRYIGTTLELTKFTGIVRYTDPNLGIPIITIAITFFMLLIGIGIFVRSQRKLPWLFAGTLVAFLGNALPQSQFGTLPSTLSEFLMILSLMVTESNVSVSPTPSFSLDSTNLLANKV